MKNKYQEALEWYAEHTSFNQFTIDVLQWADETLQELVDKETPMKLYCGRMCGKCKFHTPIKSRGDIYCKGCGQKIDWGNENVKD